MGRGLIYSQPAVWAVGWGAGPAGRGRGAMPAAVPAFWPCRARAMSWARPAAHALHGASLPCRATCGPCQKAIPWTVSPAHGPHGHIYAAAAGQPSCVTARKVHSFFFGQHRPSPSIYVLLPGTPKPAAGTVVQWWSALVSGRLAATLGPSLKFYKFFLYSPSH